jgi:DNA-binding NarL/FixJ family response regulator
MSAPWQRAHERLVTQLQVREHRRPERPEPRLGGRPAGKTVATEQRKRRIAALLEQGKSKKEIAALLEVSLKTIQNYAAAIDEEKANG